MKKRLTREALAAKVYVEINPDQTVGRRYHKPGYIGSGAIRLTVCDAEAQGYGACWACYCEDQLEEVEK